MRALIPGNVVLFPNLFDGRGEDLILQFSQPLCVCSLHPDYLPS